MSWGRMLAGCLLVGLLTLGGGVVYLHHDAASGQPTLAEVPEIALPPSARAGLPDVWPQLLAAADALLDDAAEPGEVLLAVGAPERAAVDAVDPQSAAISMLRALDAPHVNVRVPPHARLADNTDLRPLGRLCSLWLVNAWRSALEGDTTQAVAEAVAVWRVGRLLLEGESDLDASLLGLSVERIALKEMRELLEGPARSDAAALALAAEALAEGSDTTMVRALASDWLLMERELIAMPEPGCDDIYPDEGPESWQLICKILPMIPGAFQRELTQAWLRTSAQRSLARASLPRWEWTGAWTAPERFHWGPHESADGVAWKRLAGELLHNPLGRATVDMLSLGHLPFLVADKAHKMTAQRHVLQTWVALRRQALATEGPTDPGQLVPQWLAAVPIDPLDGQPVRVRDGVVYSVGVDAEQWQVRTSRSDGRRGGELIADPDLRIQLAAAPAEEPAPPADGRR